MVGNYKIRVNNEAESEEAQELFEKLRYKPFTVKRVGMVAVENNTIYPDFIENWDKYIGEELILSQLRDMVSLYSDGANKSTPAYKQVIKYQSEDGMLFDTEQECVNYQNERKLVTLLEDNIYALRHEDGGEVLDLIKQHKDLFLDYLNNC